MKNTNNNTQIMTEELVENSKHYFENYQLEFNKQIEIADDRLKKIDEKGTFKSDDEIGWFFKQIKVIQDGITRFKIN